MSVSCFAGPTFVRLSPCRRKLLIEATRIEGEYEAEKRNYSEAHEISEVVLEMLSRVESMQTQEARLLLEHELGLIDQWARGLINKTITKTSTDFGMSLEHIDVGHGTQGASSGKRGVRMGQYLGWATYTEPVIRSCSLAVPSWEMEIPVANYKNTLLRKPQ